MVSWSLLLLLPLVFASPSERRAEVACGQYDTITSSTYSLLTNQWGKSSASSGWQCSTLESVHGNTVKWHTQWDWEGGNSIKSFSNVQLNAGVNQELCTISSMQSTWHWSQSGSGVVADVAYDLFTSYSAGGSNVHEVMIWLASINSQPISYEYDDEGQAVPTTTSLDIAGHTWNLHQGSNGCNEVFSFIPVSGHIAAFSGNILEFFQYLIEDGCIQSSEYLVTAQAGVEATCGSATFKTSAYNLSIH